MKRYALFLAVLLAAVLAFNSCGKKENPYEPNTDAAMGSVAANMVTATAIAFSPGLGNQMTDFDGDASNGIQGEVIIIFPVNMSASTVNLTNVELTAYNPSGNEITGLAYTYYPEIRRMVISGTFANNKRYKITLKTGLRSQGGAAVDGNGNQRFDGSPYDEYVRHFRTGAPTDPVPDLTHPVLTGWSPGTASFTGEAIAIVLTFDAGDFDTLSVKNSVSLRDSAGNPVAIKSDGVAGNQMSFIGNTAADTLRYNTRYYVTVAVNSITDSQSVYGKRKATWSDYGYVASVPNLEWTFRRRAAAVAGQDITPLHIVGAYYDGPTAIRVAFDDSLDYSTVTSNNAKVFRMSGGQIVETVSLRVFYYPGDVSARQFRFTTVDMTPGNTYRIWLSRNLRDNAGWYFDNNGNGIGGEAENDRLGIPSDDYVLDFTYTP